MPLLCPSCQKNKRVWCPHSALHLIQKRISPMLRREISGSTPPHVFVGHSFYPKVFCGPLVSLNHAPDDPRQMYGMGIERLLEARAGMVFGMARIDVRERGRLYDEMMQAAMSIAPVGAEAKFSKKPNFAVALDRVLHPLGSSAPIERFRLLENPSIPKKVDGISNDSMPAQEAVGELVSGGFDVHYISKLLAVGALGRKGSRKMVPTRWAITASDDMAAKHHIEAVKSMKEIGTPSVFSNSHLDNHFEILLLPGAWEYEQFEASIPKDYRKGAGLPFSCEYEGFFGRKGYAESQGGGYYAARFAVAEALSRMRRQARVVVFREIGCGYGVPLGVWEVRESVRRAFEKGGESFGSESEALEAIASRLSAPIFGYMAKSRILKQRRLAEF